MEIVEQIGAYAGFAAVVGLAVLSALYFSQARDVRRLREWAGRGPERAAEEAARAAASAAPGRPSVGPARPQQPAPGATPPVPQPGPGAARPPAPGAPQKAPAPQPATAVVASSGAAPAGAAPAGGPTTPAARPPPAPATKPAQPPAPGGKPPAAPAPATRPAAAPAKSAAPATRPPLRPQAAPPARGTTRPPWYRRVAPRYLALIVAGILIVGGGVAYGVAALVGDDAGEQAGGPAGEASDSNRPVEPSRVTVSVLNGTTVPGLAAQIGDEVVTAGFQRGNVANATEQERAESAVLYADGAAREARSVARRLNISQIEPINPEAQSLAGDATVVVIVGADQTQ